MLWFHLFHNYIAQKHIRKQLFSVCSCWLTSHRMDERVSKEIPFDDHSNKMLTITIKIWVYLARLLCSGRYDDDDGSLCRVRFKRGHLVEDGGVSKTERSKNRHRRRHCRRRRRRPRKGTKQITLFMKIDWRHTQRPSKLYGCITRFQLYQRISV